MTEQDFIPKLPYKFEEQGEVEAKCSSNIALIKYWGKYHPQIPANPSISYTLTNSFTKTKIFFKKSDKLSVELYLKEKKEELFSKKIKSYFESIKKYLPFIDQYEYQIYTENSFPHSSGIASSASGFGAIATCLIKISELLGEKNTLEYKERKASFLARLGSGSACRSLYKGLVVWGEHIDIPNSSNLYGTPYPFHVAEIFKEMQDTILLIDEGQKEISSTIGHNLMNNHPYAENRFNEAFKNILTLSHAIQTGDIDLFGKIVEHEALSLHAMMLTSNPPFILMQSGTLNSIKKIWNFRKKTNLHLFFTLDAGANIHLLYPNKEKELINDFIKNDLLQYTENNNYIKDAIFY